MNKPRRASAIVACALVAAGVPAAALATHGNQPEKFPAYYEDQVRQVMMGPSGNSQNPNQAPSPCWGLGPNFSQTNRSADVPIFYTLFVPGATQMMCPNGSLTHDMVLTAVPGDPGYNGAVQLVRCGKGPNFATADTMPYTSAQEVEAGIAAGALNCTPVRVLAAPVVG
ncbi:MAG TPA: hypothetical protein VNT54_00375 [Solirubrobacteraceae bacterium]|nr:hypothetical protein [Solirubrobacteraceae bacterium]